MPSFSQILAQSVTDAGVQATVVYATAADLPLSGNTAGDIAFVGETNRMYIFNGNGWYNIALINTNPTITTGPEGNYIFEKDGTPTVLTLAAADPEGIPIVWSYSVTGGSLGSTATVTQTDNVFTITPSTLEADAGQFGVTFTASDGVNIATSIESNFSLSFAVVFQGELYGYASGGLSGAAATSSIDKFSFTSDGNATTVGNITVARYMIAGHSSITHGYTSGGRVSGDYNIIDKFAFATDGNATDVGDLSQTRVIHAGVSDKAGGSGYSAGGYSGGTINSIDKFSFISDGNAIDHADLSRARERCTDQSSESFGYVTGNWNTSTIHFDKFPFASNANATGVGELTTIRDYTVGQSSPDYGYNSGGRTSSNVIDKFSFASDGNATDVGDLTVARQQGAGQSSTTSGYTSGGTGAVIDKFSFASDGNATAVGSLVGTKSTGAAGAQV